LSKCKPASRNCDQNSESLVKSAKNEEFQCPRSSTPNGRVRHRRCVKTGSFQAFGLNVSNAAVKVDRIYSGESLRQDSIKNNTPGGKKSSCSIWHKPVDFRRRENCRFHSEDIPVAVHFCVSDAAGNCRRNSGSRGVQ
jgi:hypothetical protein